MGKKILKIITVLLMVAAAVFGYQRYQRKKAADDIPLKVYGNIDIRDAALAFSEQERIVEILVEEGQRVEKGQLLARQRSERIEAAIAEIKAKIAAQMKRQRGAVPPASRIVTIAEQSSKSKRPSLKCGKKHSIWCVKAPARKI